MLNAGAASILIVDDDPGAIHLIRRALSDYSDVRFATNGKDALRLMQEATPDLVLLDGEMPGEHGFEVCRKIKADERLAEVPVIFVTAHNDVRFETQALSLGASDFIAKPVSAPIVQLRVNLHLQLKNQVDQLRHLAMTDGLTGLPNRRAFEDALEREWRRSERSRQPLSLLLLDVDFFKLYNDEYGHPAGDECLRVVADFIGRAARRPTDLAGRYGGEEFAVLLADTPLEGALHVAHDLRAAVVAAALPHRGSKVAPHVTVSIGLSCRSHAQSTDGARVKASAEVDQSALTRAADMALYAAKARGRNRVECAALDGDPMTLPLRESVSA